MMFATQDDGSRDGRLVIVSKDHERFLPGPVATLQQLLEEWHSHVDALSGAAAALDEGAGEKLDIAALLAPLPRSWQWLDGSAFTSHGALMQRAFKMPPIESDLPLMYQGLSHTFLSACADVRLPSEAHGIDFEGEFGVITDDVPMGVTAEAAMDHIRLVVQINDWSLRTFAASEMKTGFGWIQAKPACSVAPVAVTPDELGAAWRKGRVCLPLHVHWNGEDFGRPNGSEMAFGFHELLAHAALTRSLPAGTIIGSGTVSNDDYATHGSTCVSERRGIEMIEQGAPKTDFLRFGDRIQMEAVGPDGQPLFGTLDQLVVQA
ncbi:fumarylacetoacetate hydrolase family protein [Sphingomonas glaciei]|uniref:Fumarylacetoacetate hydrolase family protein n=1 Tax=Sphingomonas glaciei TaxID=2938948 RepID=A0ABY5N254_9SPHN|nr:fumarylacetoacetate hydrolase family protein [Sphingomonas glaciei]UUR09363.1 fumarylacetoacetate hydrolase family protein [Sphingomonas glaciei]